MKVLDLNILLYAINRDSPRHADAKAWLERAISGEEPWRSGARAHFLRLSTSRQAFARPISTAEAFAVVDGWFAQEAVVALSPGEEHWAILRNLALGAGTAGNLTTDAHLATLAIENGAELCSTDADFARFPHLRWLNPLPAAHACTAQTNQRRSGA